MASYSVLMSVYIKENPVIFRDSIASVMKQSIVPDDFVIVCDGPLTDELNKVLDEAKKKYKVISEVRLEKNQGLGIALAQGLLKTKNEIVMRMDSDDLCLPNRAELELPLMEKYDLVGGFVNEFENEPTNIIGCRKVPENYEKIRKFAVKRCPFNHPTAMYKKSAILDAGNYQHFYYLEDYYLWIRLLQKNDKVYNLQQVLVNMRSGREMRKRRASKEARKSVAKLRKFMYKSGFTSWFAYIWYTFVYNVLLLMPFFIKKHLYKMLHKQ